MENSLVLGHRPVLDGLRGLAILAVLLFHTNPPVATGGLIGVEVFFVLSGFLITALLLEEHQRDGRISLRRFYLRRALRLLPALLAVLISLWAGTLLWGSQADIVGLRKDSVAVLLYVHNWRLLLAPWRETSFQLLPLWSLSVEEQFYLVWPAILAFLLAWRARRWALALVVLAVLVPPVLRAVLWHGIASFRMVYFPTHTRADGLACGCLVALLSPCWAQPGLWGRLALRASAWLALVVLLAHLFAGQTPPDLCRLPKRHGKKKAKRVGSSRRNRQREKADEQGKRCVPQALHQFA